MLNGMLKEWEADRGTGVTCAVQIPRVEDPEVLAPVRTDWGPDHADPRCRYADQKILVVDDDRDTRQLIVTMLEADGLAAMQAPNGSVAMALAVNECPDLVILDVLMPGLDGYSVCRQLREDACLRGPVIMMTGLTGLEDELEGIACGADAYLAKPVSRLELLARVHDLI